MKKIITNDSSETFFNDEFNETYHSNTGAVEESYEKFAKPCLEFLKDKKEINVLDFCFGLGYNSAALIELLDYNINIICIDNDDKCKKIAQNGYDLYEKYLKQSGFKIILCESDQPDHLVWIAKKEK